MVCVLERWRLVTAGIAVASLAVLAPRVAATETVFEDVSSMSGLDFVHDNGATGALYLPEIMGPGGALLDYDRDGDLDVYLVQGHRLDSAMRPAARDRLYRNDSAPGQDPSFVFVDVTDRAGIVSSAYGIGAATGDYDNDGWVDLYVANLGSNQLLRNNGDGTFSDRTATAGADDPRWSVTSSFLDFDADGWLDLWVVNYLDFNVARRRHCLSPTGAPDYCDPNAYEPVADLLLRNRGDGSFQPVTSDSGFAIQPAPGLGVVAADFNRDGLVDVYVTNDGMPNQLYLNGGDGTFSEDAAFAGCAVSGEGASEASMGVTASDLDNDGDEDLFMTHLNKETNTLYLNDGGGFFTDATDAARLGVPSWNYTGFGIAALDFDLDGLLDLMVVNGAVTFFAGGAERRLEQVDQLYRNLDGRSFAPVEAGAGGLGAPAVSRGLLAGDVDNDGDADALVLNNGAAVRVLRNRLGVREGWVGVEVLSYEAGSALFGATAKLWEGEGAALHRRAHTDGSYASAGDPRMLFGLGRFGDPSSSAELTVRAPGRGAVRFVGPPAGRYLRTYLASAEAGRSPARPR